MVVTRIIKTVVILLLIVGVLLVFSPKLKDGIVEHTVQSNLQQMKKIINNPNKIEKKMEIKKNEEKKVSYDFNKIVPISLPDVVKASTQKLPVIGEIKVPSVGIDLPVIKGISSSSLAAGAGTMKENQIIGKGNFALASHHMINPHILFGPLDWIQIGAAVYLSDGNRTYKYSVIKKEVISPYDTHVINDQPGQTLVTLITCHAGGIDRLMVVGKLIQ